MLTLLICRDAPLFFMSMAHLSLMIAVWHQGCVASERSNLLFVIGMLAKLWIATTSDLLFFIGMLEKLWIATTSDLLFLICHAGETMDCD